MIRIAFDGRLPDLCGARRYQGDFETADIARELSEKEREDYAFLKDKGLYSGVYRPDETADLAKAKALLKRIHYYIGGSETDDFGATLNRDFLYDKDPQDGKGPEDEVRESTLVSSATIYENVVEVAELAIKEDGATYGSFAHVLHDFGEDKPRQTPADSDMAMTLGRMYMEEASDFEALWKVETELLQETGSCSFFVHKPTEISAFLDKEGRLFGCDIASVANSALLGQLAADYNYDLENFLSAFDLRAYVEERLSSFGDLASYSENTYEKAMEFLDGYCNYVKSLPELPNPKASQVVYLQDNDPFLSVESTYSLAGLFEEADDDLPFVATVMNAIDYSLLAYIGSIASEATEFDAIRAFCFLGYADRVCGGYADFYSNLSLSIPSMIGYNLMSYFKTTSYYAAAVSRTKGLFDELITALKSNATGNGWLSPEGILALEAKADKVYHYLYAEFEGNRLDYTPYFSFPFSADLGENLFLRNVGDLYMHADFMQKEMEKTYSMREYYSLAMEPFTANAYYVPVTNGIYITSGYLFSKDYDVSAISEGDFLATFGMVMGHEITHGFDSNGCYFDGDGNHIPTSIFPADDLRTFRNKQNEVKALYEYEVMPGITQNGSTVLSEALADIGGLGVVLTIASSKSNFDYASFFRSLAGNFMGKCSRATYRDRYATDSHPYGAARVNPLLMSKAKFQETFSLSPKDGMYRDPAKEIVIW